MHKSIPLLIAVAIAHPALYAQEARVFALKESGQRVTLETIVVPEGETRMIACGGEAPYIDVIAPPAPGGSGRLAQSGLSRVIAARNVGGELHLLENPAKSQRRLPLLENPHEYDIRVSVTSATGGQYAYLISNWRDVDDDKVGPVIDMFAGRVPMKPGDYVICTDTTRVHHEKKTYGIAPLRYDRYLLVRGELPGGRSGDFIVDLGAGTTLVDRSFLPDDTDIRESHMVQYSAAGKKLLKYEPGGATGKVESILGHADLAGLRFGDITFEDVSVAVISELPIFGGHEAAGILGIDLLRRAEFLSLEYPDANTGTGRLRMSRTPTVGADAVALPFSTVNTHPMIKVAFNETPVSVILDTGAPGPILDRQAARAAGIAADAPGRAARGLDQGTAEIDPATADKLTIGSHVLHGMPIHIGALPVFAPMRSHNQSVGLLGNSVLARFKGIELDFNARTLRLEP